MEFEYIEDQRVVLCRTFGHYELMNGVELLKELVLWLKKNNCKKCLVDHSAATVSMSTTVSYSRPNEFKNLGFNNTSSGAIVFKELTQECYFYEDVCQNRGWNVKVFDNYNEAMDWLIK